jgi:hypothetical protein
MSNVQVSSGSRRLVARNVPARVSAALPSGQAPPFSVSASDAASAPGGIGGGARSRSTTCGAAPAGEQTGVVTDSVEVWNVSLPPQVKPAGHSCSGERVRHPERYESPRRLRRMHGDPPRAARAATTPLAQLSGTTWSQQAYVKASNTGANDLFGSSVALSNDGSTLAVGAHGEDSATFGIGGNQADNSAADAGAVYVFTRSGATWNQQAYLKASNTDAGDIFGASVALSGDGATLAVGAGFEVSAATGIGGDQTSNSAMEAGVVYVFTRSGAAWSQQAYVKASNTGAGDRFGGSVGLTSDGATLVVGASDEESAATGIGGNQTDNSATYAGAAYVFQ